MRARLVERHSITLGPELVTKSREDGGIDERN